MTANPQGPDSAFGKYQLLRQVGEGAFGVVYEAKLPGPMGFTKRLAIKRIHSHLVKDDPRFVQSMVNEARIGGLLHHPNIVDILEFGQVDGDWYLAMEFVDGISLSRVLALCRERGVRMPDFAVVDMALQVCRGLQYAHDLRDEGGQRLHLVHRDIKPSNVMLDTTGTAKLCDFGIAKATTNLYMTTASASIKGTPRYMSPEQITSSDELDLRSDVFSLGALLFEAMSGEVLFPGDGLSALLQAILHDDLDERLDGAERAFPGCRPLLARALERQPEDRYPSAMAMAEDLRALGRTYPAEAEMSEVVNRLIAAAGSLPATETGTTARGRPGPSTSLDPPVAPAGPTQPGRRAHPPMAAGTSGWGDFTVAFFERPVAPDAEVHEGAASPETVPQMHTIPEAAPESTVPLMKVIPEQGSTAPLTAPAAADDTGDFMAPAPGRRWLAPAIGFALVALVLLVLLVFRPWGGAVDDPEPRDPSGDLDQAPDPGESAKDGAAAADAGVTPDMPVAPEPDEPRSPPELAETSLPEAPPEREQATPRLEEAPEREAPPTASVKADTPAAPGTISLSVRPWADIYVDDVMVTSGNALRAHPVDGGVHRVRAVCSVVGHEVKEFKVTVDGDGVMLGCWDFEAMAACDRSR